jgi:hypothetical protein
MSKFWQFFPKVSKILVVFTLELAHIFPKFSQIF